MKELKKNVETEIIVRLVECDSYKIAHNSSYFVWFEIGRFDYAKLNGYKITSMAADEDVVYFTLFTKCKFIKSVKFDDEIIVKTRINKLPILYAKYSFEQEIYNKATGELVARCITENAAIDKKTKKVLKLSLDNEFMRLERDEDEKQ
jgi:acyl-CoA thioester hydrolase